MPILTNLHHCFLSVLKNEQKYSVFKEKIHCINIVSKHDSFSLLNLDQSNISLHLEANISTSFPALAMNTTGLSTVSEWSCINSPLLIF